MVKDYYETSGTSALWSKRGRGSKRRKCEVNVNDNKQWPDCAPIVTTTANSALFPDEKNILELTSGLKASCGKDLEKSFFGKFESAPFLLVACKHGDHVQIKYSVYKEGSSTRGGSWKETIAEVRFSELYCKHVPEPTVVKEPTSENHKFVWEIDGGSVAVIDKVVISKGKKIPKYTSHILRGETIANGKEGDSGRPSGFRYTPEIPEADQMDPKIYQMKDQKCLFGSIHAALSDKIDCCVSNYLVHGHLVPNADFFYKAWRDATFHMTNVAPQWQAINNRNWKRVEKAVREYAKSKKRDMTIFTGTHGVLKIDGHNIILPKAQKPSVPSHFWKILHDPKEKAAVAFVIVNNPYASEEPGSPGLPSKADRMCTTQCDLLQSKNHNPTPSGGLLMCCSVGDLRKKITDLPIIPDENNTLFDSAKLKEVLEKVN
jgi:DNA/RNA endonuclease G (NUC1)